MNYLVRGPIKASSLQTAGNIVEAHDVRIKLPIIIKLQNSFAHF